MNKFGNISSATGYDDHIWLTFDTENFTNLDVRLDSNGETGNWIELFTITNDVSLLTDSTNSYIGLLVYEQNLSSVITTNSVGQPNYTIQGDSQSLAGLQIVSI